MTEELKALINELDSAYFRFAHITGALEFYMLVLENPILQRAISKASSGTETEWKQIHRFKIVDGQIETWYPELPVQRILAEKDALFGYLYGVTLSRVIGDLDFYLRACLTNANSHHEDTKTRRKRAKSLSFAPNLCVFVPLW